MWLFLYLRLHALSKLVRVFLTNMISPCITFQRGWRYLHSVAKTLHVSFWQKSGAITEGYAVMQNQISVLKFEMREMKTSLLLLLRSSLLNIKGQKQSKYDWTKATDISWQITQGFMLKLQVERLHRSGFSGICSEISGSESQSICSLTQTPPPQIVFKNLCWVFFLPPPPCCGSMFNIYGQLHRSSFQHIHCVQVWCTCSSCCLWPCLEQHYENIHMTYPPNPGMKYLKLWNVLC